jgi:hypothetical protein
MSHSISLELRFLSIPTSWTRRKDRMSGEFALVPQVKVGPAKPIEDAWALRNDFLRMEHSEEAALKFLERVGVWGVGESGTYEGAKPIQGAFGYRYIIDPQYPFPFTIEELWDEQERWKALLGNPARLQAEFGERPKEDARPYDHFKFACDTQRQNTLPIHLESKLLPHAVIQPITGRELLTATAWVDLVSGSGVQVCEKCKIPFTSYRKLRFCPPPPGHATSPCAHAVAQHAYRIREEEKERQRRGNLNSPKVKPKKKASR